MKNGNGYETAGETVDPRSFAFFADVAESVQQQLQHRQGPPGWHAKRFKKFPRFNIYLQKDKSNSYLEKNYISLNNKMLEFLTEEDPTENKKSQNLQNNDIDSLESAEISYNHHIVQETNNNSLQLPTNETVHLQKNSQDQSINLGQQSKQEPITTAYGIILNQESQRKVKTVNSDISPDAITLNLKEAQ